MAGIRPALPGPGHALADPGRTLSVLNPTATFSDDINQDSIVLKMTRRSVFFLLIGDANADAESRIANSRTNLQADILKVGNHGSATSSSLAFLTKVHPKIVSSKWGREFIWQSNISDLWSPGPGGDRCESHRPEWLCHGNNR